MQETDTIAEVDILKKLEACMNYKTIDQVDICCHPYGFCDDLMEDGADEIRQLRKDMVTLVNYIAGITPDRNTQTTAEVQASEDAVENITRNVRSKLANGEWNMQLDTISPVNEVVVDYQAELLSRMKREASHWDAEERECQLWLEAISHIQKLSGR